MGDIESQPFIESIRQLGLELKSYQTLFLHLTLVPYLKNAGELKTKPTQHSVKEFRSLGLQPDILICRSDFEIPPESKEKIALFCSMPNNGVFSLPNLDTIYEVPVFLDNQGIDKILTKKMHLEKISQTSTRGKRLLKENFSQKSK